MKSAIYPGTFDPITLGHLDVIERALRIFDKITVAVATNPEKKLLFTLEERMGLVKESTRGMGNVEVEPLSGMLVDYARKKRIFNIVRGLREITDFQSEFQRAITNRKLEPKIDTVFIPTSAKYFYLSSTVVKEIASFKGEISCFVPKPVEKALKKKFA
jgi:pantetheine-phosphate adenylyltransferase